MKEPEFNQTNTEQNFNGKTSDEKELIDKETKKPKKFDNILTDSVGMFGLFQAWLLFLLFFCQATFAPAIYGSVFTDFTPKHHCAREELEVFNLTKWEEKDNRCNIVEEGNKTECSIWVYDQSVFHETVAADFNIVCDQAYLKPLSGTLRMSGLLIGSFIFGWLSDSCGRVPSLTLAGILLFTSQIVAGFSTNYLMFSVLTVVMAAGGVGSYLVSFVLLFEWACPEYRTMASVFAQIPFAVGYLYTVLIAWCVRYWQTLQWVLAIPNTLFFILFFIIPESPRWLVSQGKTERALKSIKVAAKSNNLQVPKEVYIEKDLGDEKTKKLGIFILIAHPVLCYRLVIMSFNWIVITLCFYGLSLNSANEDLFTGMSMMAFVELMAYIITLFIIDYFGRRPILSVCQLLAGLSCVCAGFVPMSYYWLRLCLALVGKMGASAGFAVVFVYSAELFPTPVRNSAIGLCSTLARIGALLAPVIASLESVLAFLPFLIMGGAAMLVGSLSFLLPETRGGQLPETVEEAATIGTKTEHEGNREGNTSTTTTTLNDFS